MAIFSGTAMTWRDNLRPASFRGVTFEVDGHEFTTGRRGQQHEYPQRDKPNFEDLGLRAGAFDVEGYVIGDDYMQRRDALIKACQQEGAGTLVHPFLGSFQVACTELKVTERLDEGRMCRIKLTLTEAGDNVYPGGGTDYGYTINKSADTAGTIAVEDFSKSFDLSGMPDFVTDDAQGVLSDISGMAAGLNGGFNTTRAANAVLSLGPAGLRNALLVGQRILSLVQSFRLDLAGNPSGIASAARSFSQYSVANRVSAVPLTTSTRLAQAGILNQLGGLISRVGLIEEGRTFPDRQFDSYQDAIGAAQDYAARMDDSYSMPGGVSDPVYQNMVKLQSDVVDYTTSAAASLPRLRSYTLPDAMPALAISYELYGDATKDADIVSRNRVRDPGAVPGGIPLEVLQQ